MNTSIVACYETLHHQPTTPAYSDTVRDQKIFQDIKFLYRLQNLSDDILQYFLIRTETGDQSFQTLILFFLPLQFFHSHGQTFFPYEPVSAR